jgi:hypothetical protein
MENGMLLTVLPETRCNYIFDNYLCAILSRKKVSDTMKDIIDAELFETLGVKVDGFCEHFILPFMTWQFYSIIDQIAGKNRFADLTMLFAGVPVQNDVDQSVINTKMAIHGSIAGCRLPIVTCVELDTENNIIRTMAPMCSDAIFLGFYEMLAAETLEFIINGKSQFLRADKGFRLPFVYCCRSRHDGFMIGYLRSTPAHAGSALLLLREDAVPRVEFFMNRSPTRLRKPATLRYRPERSAIPYNTIFAKACENEAILALAGIIEDIHATNVAQLPDGTPIDNSFLELLFEKYCEAHSFDAPGTKRTRAEYEHDSLTCITNTYKRMARIVANQVQERMRASSELLFMQLRVPPATISGVLMPALDYLQTDIETLIQEAVPIFTHRKVKIIYEILVKLRELASLVYNKLNSEDASSQWWQQTVADMTRQVANAIIP